MSPFFTYYGSKHSLAHRLGPPQRDHVVEPFAGSAGYSTYWEPRRVTLVERDARIANIWKYLVRVSAREILALPANINGVEEIPHLCPEARLLIRFWFTRCVANPGFMRSAWARPPRSRARFWSETIKLRLAHQVERIRHWQIIEGSYEAAPNTEAHWHIDPPYENGDKQRYRFREVNYPTLTHWCRGRRGFVQVCENGDATWLPFEEYALTANRAGNSVSEAVCEFENGEGDIGMIVRPAKELVS